MKPGEFVLDTCGCIYKVVKIDKDHKGRIDRVWFRHKEDTKSFYLPRNEISRLKRAK